MFANLKLFANPITLTEAVCHAGLYESSNLWQWKIQTNYEEPRE